MDIYHLEFSITREISVGLLKRIITCFTWFISIIFSVLTIYHAGLPHLFLYQIMLIIALIRDL